MKVDKEFLDEMHNDLTRRYRVHKTNIDKKWRAFTSAKRAEIFNKVTGPSGTNHLPQWNLDNIAHSGPDIFLNLLEHQATCSLENGLGAVELFTALPTLGQDPELVLLRQFDLIFYINRSVELILQETLACVDPPTSTEVAAAALSRISTQVPGKLELPALLETAMGQRDALQERYTFLRTESSFLPYLIGPWYTTHPGMIPDQSGEEQLIYITDRHLSAAFLEAIHNAIKVHATWSYITRLLELLDNIWTGVPRAKLLQEISNTCHFEFMRAQAFLRRQLTVCGGRQLFERSSDVCDSGYPRFVLKNSPERFKRDNKPLYFMLNLSQPQVRAEEAINWLKKLGALHNIDPALIHGVLAEGGKAEECFVDIVAEIAVVVGFINSLKPFISMPGFNRKKSHGFVSGLEEIRAEMTQIRPKLDLGDFIAPLYSEIDRPGMVKAAFMAFDDFMIENVGTKLGSLFTDLTDDCIARLRALKAHYETAPDNKPTAKPDLFRRLKLEARIKERQEKDKVRPKNSSIYDIIASTDGEAAPAVDATLAPELLKMNASTSRVLRDLFHKSIPSFESSTPWVEFKSALTDLGFSVTSNDASVYTFIPPKEMMIQKPLILHHPRNSKVEGYTRLLYAHRLNRLYGWSKDTFEIAPHDSLLAQFESMVL